MNFEWIHVAIGIISAFIGAVGGLIAGVWRVAHIEQKMREDFKVSIDKLKDDNETKVESLVGQFEESFKALRQKINDVELNTEKHFLSKDGFNDFRREYREDMNKLMEKIDAMNTRPRK
jgi:uncharacterized protein YktB (UPF0637 family)